jgi:hypothetical protein
MIHRGRGVTWARIAAIRGGLCKSLKRVTCCGAVRSNCPTPVDTGFFRFFYDFANGGPTLPSKYMVAAGACGPGACSLKGNRSASSDEGEHTRKKMKG